MLQNNTILTKEQITLLINQLEKQHNAIVSRMEYLNKKVHLYLAATLDENAAHQFCQAESEINSVIRCSEKIKSLNQDSEYTQELIELLEYFRRREKVTWGGFQKCFKNIDWSCPSTAEDRLEIMRQLFLFPLKIVA